MAINRDKVNAAAIKLLQAGKYDKAIAELRKLVEDDPSDVRTILKIGDTYVKMGSRAEAIQSYERVAQIYSEQGFYLKAVAVFKQMLRVDGNLPDVHLKLAELYQQLGLTSDCLQHFQQVAIFYEQSGRAKDSLGILKRMVDLDPDNLPSRIKLAELFAQQGQMPDAVQEFRSAAAYLLTQQREDDFLRVGERLIFFDPGALDMTRQLAEIYLKRGDAKLALGKLQLCFKTDPRNLETLGLIAKAFFDMQQVPKTVSVYKEMARIYESQGQMGEARTHWDRVLELAPGDEDAETALGMKGGAPSAMGGGLPGMPTMPGSPSGSSGGAGGDDEQIQRMLTETDVYVKYGLKDKAAEHIQKILALRPEHTIALEKLKTLYQKMGERLRLRMALDQLVAAARNQNDPRLSEWEAELVAAGGTMSQAKAGGSSRTAPQPRSSEGEIILVDEDAAVLDSIDAIAAAEPSQEEAFDPEAADLPLDEPVDSVEGEAIEEIAVESASGETFIDEGEQVLPADEVLDGGMAEQAGYALHAQEEELLLPDELDGLDAPAAPPPLHFGQQAQSFDTPKTIPPVIDEMADALTSQDADQLVRQALADLEAERPRAAGATPSDDFGLPPLGDGADFDAAFMAGGDGGETDFSEATIAPPVGGDDSFAGSQLPSATADAVLESDAGFDGGFDDDAGGAPPGPRTTSMPHNFTEVDPSQMDIEPVSEIGAEVEAALVSQLEGDAPFTDDEFAAATSINTEGDDLVARVKDEINAGKAPLPPEFDVGTSPSRALDDPTLDIQRRGSAAHPRTDLSGGLDESSPPTASQEDAFAADGGPSPAASGDGGVSEEQPELRTAGKLGFESKNVGFENDPANTFFPDELEEAEFFISQGLLDEAKEIVQSILEEIEDSARAQYMLSRIEAQENGLPDPPAPWEQKIFDEVASELESLGEAAEAPAPTGKPDASMQISVEEVLSQFKKGISETVADDDAATHYDLGIAYREMGLLDDAIGEFNLAARAPARTADARYLVGLTYMDKGAFDDALEAFEGAIGGTSNKEQQAANEYQRGICFVSLARGKDALRAFKRAKRLGNPAGDLDRRVQKLVDEHGDVASDDDEEDHPGARQGDEGGKPGRPKNIDYV